MRRGTRVPQAGDIQLLFCAIYPHEPGPDARVDVLADSRACRALSVVVASGAIFVSERGPARHECVARRVELIERVSASATEEEEAALLIALGVQRNGGPVADTRRLYLL